MSHARFVGILFGLSLVLVAVLTAMLMPRDIAVIEAQAAKFWAIQSVDTMKYSRDLANEKLYDAQFSDEIDAQMNRIEHLHASYVAIGTPYDDKFLPFLKRWVKSARAHGLKVWFRGNFSGWEGWFGFPKITSAEHQEKLNQFILDHIELFEDGDIFSPCPECENGGPGDPRQTGDVEGYRKFLIDEYAISKNAFKSIGRDVQSNFFSMNADVAQVVMDAQTTTALGGLVTLDHYAKTPESFIETIQTIAKKSRGKIMIGELGVPIPDIHGSLSNDQQADWVYQALLELSHTSEVIGVNYWVAVGGTTQLWNTSGVARPVVEVVNRFYDPGFVWGVVRDEVGRGLPNTKVTVGERVVRTDNQGYFSIPYLPDTERVVLLNSDQHLASKITFATLSQKHDIILKRTKNGLIDSIILFIRQSLLGDSKQ